MSRAPSGGGRGILTSAHFAAREWVTLATGYEPALGHRLAVLAAAVFAEPNPTVVKAVLHAQGRIPTPNVRLPLLPAGARAVEAALARLAPRNRGACKSLSGGYSAEPPGHRAVKQDQIGDQPQ